MSEQNLQNLQNYKLLITKTQYCPNTSTESLIDHPILVTDIEFDSNGNIISAIHLDGFNQEEEEIKIINTVFYRKHKDSWQRLMSDVESWILVNIPKELLASYLSIPKSYTLNGTKIGSKEKQEAKAKIIKHYKDVTSLNIKDVDWTLTCKPKTIEEKIEQSKARELYEKLMPLFQLKDADSIFIFGEVSYNDIWAKKEKNILGLNVNTSDIIAWGGSDCHELNYSNIDKFIVYYNEWDWAGIVMWFCEELNVRPQAAVIKLLKERGEWDILKDRMEKLSPNHDEIKGDN